ncbi:MAG: hypothetical protein EHM61_13760 [Acidobacteria bacterium]|nr:MAG: hypothetical protein EHM61_13760 [Acidobacteriota bacterium]
MDDIKLTNLPEEEKKKESEEELKDVRGGFDSALTTNMTGTVSTTMTTNIIDKGLTSPTLNQTLFPLAGK